MAKLLLSLKIQQFRYCHNIKDSTRTTRGAPKNIGMEEHITEQESGNRQGESVKDGETQEQTRKIGERRGNTGTGHR